MTRIKICGLFRPEDIGYVNEAKPDWCGFIINFPQSHRNCTPDRVRELCRNLEKTIVPVGVFVNQPVEIVAALLNEGTLSAAQLHGQEDSDYIAALRTLAPGKEIWRAFQIHGEADVRAANDCPADMVLLDGGQGAGRGFDWTLITGMQRPFLLAGGLTPETIRSAIRMIRPYGIDLSSGVETDHIKDRNKVLAAVGAARKDG